MHSVRAELVWPRPCATLVVALLGAVLPLHRTSLPKMMLTGLSPMQTGGRSSGCSAWRGQDSRETLKTPSSAYRAQSCRGTLDKGLE